MTLSLVLIVLHDSAFMFTWPTSVFRPLLLVIPLQVTCQQESAPMVKVPLTEKLPAASAPVTLRVPGIKQLPAVSIRKRVALPALPSRT